jgi:PAS domain S-box-containing protein
MKKENLTGTPSSIVVIEDNKGDFVLIENYLLEKFKDVEVKNFTKLSDSLDYLQDEEHKTSLVLLDLHLPDAAGSDLINQVVGLNLKMPIVILTGFADVRLAEKSLQMGIYDYLVKDEINPTILHKTVVYALNRSSFISQLEAEKRNNENLFHFSPQPTWLLDSATLQIVNANNAAQQNYGFFLEDFLNMNFTQLHPEEEEILITQKLTSEKGALNKSQFIHYLSSGNEIKVEINFEPIQVGSDSRLIVQANDVTSRLHHLETIENQSIKLKEIAWTQSHVVRASITRMLGIIDMVEEQPDNLEKRDYWVKQLRNSTNNIDDLVKKVIEQINRFEDNESV